MLERKSAGNDIEKERNLREIDEILMQETEPLRAFLREASEVSPDARAITEAMERLRTRYRKSWLLLYLLFYEGVSPDEIIAAGGSRVTRDQIRKDKSRALKRLAAILEGDEA